MRPAARGPFAEENLKRSIRFASVFWFASVARAGDLPPPADALRSSDDRACRAGDQKSCVRLASSLMLGKNADRLRARSLLEATCKANEPEACGRLGSYLDGGVFDGVKDPPRALRYYERGCALGQSNDC